MLTPLAAVLLFAPAEGEYGMKEIRSNRTYSGVGIGTIVRIGAILLAVGFFLLRGLYAGEPPPIDTRKGLVDVVHARGDGAAVPRATGRRLSSALRADKNG